MRTKDSDQHPHQNRGRRKCVILALAVALAPATARAARLPLYGGLPLCTPTVTVPAGAAVYCLAIAKTPATQPINVLVARILARGGRLVTQFGYGFAAAPGVVSVGWYAEEFAGSFSPRSRYCQVVIDPADASLTVDFAVHVNGQIVYEANEKSLGPCPTNSGQKPVTPSQGE